MEANAAQKLQLYIRADANEKIGTGHVMRCMSVARQVLQSGGEVLFLAADDRTVRFVEEKGFACECLQSQWDDLEQELPKLTRLIAERQVEHLLVDTYYVTANYLSTLRELTDVTYVDDLAAFDYPVNRLVNYNFYGPETDYHCSGCEEYLLGPSYVPLREEFRNRPKREFKGLRKILITSGGTDPFHVIDSFLEKLLQTPEFQDCEFYCILGRFQADREELERKYAGAEKVHLLCNVNNMGDYMGACDAVVTAGGSTTYELCACGLPGVIYTFVDNQLGIAKSADALGLFSWIGDLREGVEACGERLAQALLALRDEKHWTAVSRKQQETVDGEGAIRLMRHILRMRSEQ